MRIWLGIGLGLIVAAAALPTIGLAAITTGYTSAGGFQVAAGVDYDFGSLIVDGSAWRSVDILEIDPTEPSIGLELSLAHGIASGKATTIEQALANSADGHRVVATSNGSLFSFLRQDDIVVAEMGLGLNVSNGELINAGNPSLRSDLLPAFAIDQNGTPMIGTPDLEAELTLPGGETVAIDRINQARFDGDVVLYTSRLGSHTWTDNLGDEYVIEGFDLPLRPTGSHSGTVVAVRRDAGDGPIAPGQVVLSVSNTAGPWSTALEVGSAVSVSLAVDGGWDAVSQSVGGRNMLVVDGQNVTPQPEVDGSHARTAVGIDTAGKVLLVGVDNGSFRKGLRLTEIADLMISLGAVDAVNLDGGTSTQMAVRHPGDVGITMVTAPARDGIYRPVANALQVVSHAPDGPLDRLVLTPERATASIGEEVAFTAKGQDADLNGLALDPSALQWSVEPASGQAAGPSFTAEGSVMLVTGDQLGDFLVTVRSGTFEATSQLEVAPDHVAPVVSVSEVALVDTGPVGIDRATVGVGWTAHDNVSVARVQVQRRIDSGAWREVAVSNPGAASTTSTAPFGRRVQFRARATDGAGNTSAWTLGKPVRLLAFNDNHKRVSTTGAWARKADGEAIGGQYLRSRTSGASVSISVNAVQVAAIGNRGPTHGQAAIYLNGSPHSSISLLAASMEVRRLLYLSPLLDNPAMTAVRLVNANPAAQKLVDLDAFLALVPD